MYCAKCNKEYDDSYAVCPFCGAEAEAVEEVKEVKEKDPNLLSLILSIVSIVLGIFPISSLLGLVAGLLVKFKFKPEEIAVEEGAELDEETAKKVKKIKLINILTLVGIAVSALVFVGNALFVLGIIGCGIAFGDDIINFIGNFI